MSLSCGSPRTWTTPPRHCRSGWALPYTAYGAGYEICLSTGRNTNHSPPPAQARRRHLRFQLPLLAQRPGNHPSGRWIDSILVDSRTAAAKRLPHVHTHRLNPAALSNAQLATKTIIQRLLLALLPKPQRLPSLQIAHHRQKLVPLPLVQLVHPHVSQRRLPPAGLATLQVP